MKMYERHKNAFRFSPLSLPFMIVMVLVKHCCDVVYKTDISQVDTSHPHCAHDSHIGGAVGGL